MSKETLKQFIKDGYMEDKNTSLAYAPSGCTLKNLSYTGRYKDCYRVGAWHSIVGKSDTGKSLELLTALAAIANDKRFDNYILILDDVEANLEMNIREMFGDKLADRLIILNDVPKTITEEKPEGSKKKPKSVKLTRGFTVERFRMNIRKLLNMDILFVYGVDSTDQMTSNDELKRADEGDKATEEDKDHKGDFAMAKAKFLSSFFRLTKAKMCDKKALGLMVSQGKKNISATGYGNPMTRSGGDSLKFNSLTEGWTTKKKDIKKTVDGTEYKVGKIVAHTVKKNHQNGKDRPVEYIINELGIDDVSSSIKYMLEMGAWEMEKKSIIIPEWEFKGMETTLIDFIEENNKEDELSGMVAAKWNEVENKLYRTRKKRFN